MIANPPVGNFVANSHKSSRLPAPAELDRQRMNPGVVADQQARLHPRVNPRQNLEHGRRIGKIEPRLECCTWGRHAQARLHQHQRLACAHRVGAQHEVGTKPLLAQVRADALGIARPPRVERPLVIVEIAIVPTRFRVT